MMELDTEMERKYMEDRSHQLHEAEKKIISIRDVLSDTELLAQEQGQHLDIIQENFSSSHKNVILANDELSEANTRHKKSKKKYLMLALTVLLVIGTVLVIVLLL
jgi:t-SNARE complex subunit (syntaxin)